MANSDQSVRRSIKIYDETWRQLNSRKNPGDSFDDVIQTLLDETE